MKAFQFLKPEKTKENYLNALFESAYFPAHTLFSLVIQSLTLPQSPYLKAAETVCERVNREEHYLLVSFTYYLQCFRLLNIVT